VGKRISPFLWRRGTGGTGGEVATEIEEMAQKGRKKTNSLDQYLRRTPKREICHCKSEIREVVTKGELTCTPKRQQFVRPHRVIVSLMSFELSGKGLG